MQDTTVDNIQAQSDNSGIDIGNDSTPDNTLGEKSPIPMANYKTPVAASPLDPEDHNQTAEFVEKISTGGAKLGLSPNAQEQLNSYLLEARKKYANAARRASNLSPSSSEYQKHAMEMNKISASFQTLASQVDAYKANQVDYIKDFDNDSLSHADKVNGKAGVISKLYRGALDMQVNDDGTLNFGEEGKYVPYSAIANHSVKHYDLADKMLKLTNDIYKTAAPLTPDRKALVLNQVKSLVGKAGGRDAVISLMSDGLIPGFENMDVPQELYKPENYPQLQQYFLDHIGTGIEGAAKAGYASKVAMEEARHGRSLDYGLAKMQQTYDFKQAHPTASRSGSSTNNATGATTSSQAANKKSPDEIFAATQGMPGEEITVYGIPFTVSNKKDKSGHYALIAKGNNKAISKESFINWANKHK